MSEQRAPQQNGCQCGMCFFLAMEGSKYCVAHRGIMEAFDRKRAAPLPESQPREEGVCDDCHRKYPTPWFAANPLWNRVIPDRQGMLCPNCFIWRAQKAGVGTTGWEVREEQLEPESQPSPSGDFHKELREKISLLKLYPDMDAQEFYERMEEFILRVLRSHDAKVGQAEQRLKKSLLDMLHNHGCESGPCNACKSARAALQESPSEPAR